MKLKTVTLILTICAMTATPVFATIWRVNNNNLGNLGDFTTLQAAHDGAAAGDTLYVAGSPTSYGDLTTTKRLFIFGTGYFISENPETQATPVSAKTGIITFNSGSEGSLLMGLDIGHSIVVNANDITITRNRIEVDIDGSTSLITLTDNVSNVIILQNYMHNVQTSQFRFSAHAINLVSNNQNVIISNNYLRTDYGNSFCILSPNSSSFLMQHNVLTGFLNINNATLNDNILTFRSISGASNVFNNNIGNAAQFGTANGNQSNVDLSTVFVGLTGNSTDGQWQIQPGSAAEGTGTNGVDIGMFGGPTPYVLSGLPEIPAIYFFNAPIVGTATGLPVQVKIKSHN